MTPLDLPWLVLENEAIPGELLTLTAGGTKYAVVFTEPEAAALFLAGLEDGADLRVSTLDAPVLKEAYLTAIASLGANAVMFDYRRGSHRAQTAPLEAVSGHVRSKIGPQLM